jgi:hypothetical protein
MDDISFISLGEACDVKYQILNKFKEFNNIKETYFFDWIISDFKTVLDVLNQTFLESFKKENLNIDNSNNKYQNAVVKINNYSTFVSLHDVPKNYNNTHVDNFIDKYTRRYNRLIDLIKKNNKIFFIRKTSKIISDEDQNIFRKYLNNINPDNEITLVILCDYIKEDYIIKHKLILINYEKLKLYDDNGWKGFNYNWNIILNILLNVK